MSAGSRLHRPYARKRGGPPSVTTVLGALDKPGLPWAAARETAVFAVHHRTEWELLDDGPAVARLYRHHRGVWDHRAALGTLLHSVNECWGHGETVDLAVMVEELQQGSHVWAKTPTASIVDEASVMVDGLEAAWLALNPATISIEDVVRYPHERQCYIGQSDWRAMVDGHSYLIDLKTTGQVDPKKAFYYDSWRLQLAAYRGCSEVVHYDADANETHTTKLAPVERAAILHVRADGAWEFIPVAAGGTELNVFLRLRDIFGWLKTVTDAGAEPFEINPQPEEVTV